MSKFLSKKIIIWKLLFVFCPLFWMRLWKEIRADEPLLFSCLLTFFIFAMMIIITGLVSWLIWKWPPILLIITATLVGMWMGSKGWWDKINP